MAGHKVEAFVITMISIMTSQNLSFKWTVLNCLRKTLDSVVGDTDCADVKAVRSG